MNAHTSQFEGRASLRRVHRIPIRHTLQLAARAGGANILVGTGRVNLWGAFAMAATAAIGAAVGTVV